MTRAVAVTNSIASHFAPTSAIRGRIAILATFVTILPITCACISNMRQPALPIKRAGASCKVAPISSAVIARICATITIITIIEIALRNRLMVDALRGCGLLNRAHRGWHLVPARWAFNTYGDCGCTLYAWDIWVNMA